MTVQETLDRLGLYWKRDPDFVPVKDAATVRLNVSIGGGGVELLATGPKWYDTRKEQGGGAIDLTMHLFRLWGRLRKRKKSYAKHARRLVSSVIRSEWTRRGFWPRPWAELRWAAGSFDALN